MHKVTVQNYREQKVYPRIVAAVAQVLARQKTVAPVEVFLGMGLLSADDLARWRRGEIPYLERVIRCNLTRANTILQTLRFHAHDLNLGATIVTYQRRSKPLRFSKSGALPVEQNYARHFGVIGKRNPFETAAEGAKARDEGAG